MDEQYSAEEISASRAEKRQRLSERIQGLAGERVDKFAECIVITYNEDAANPSAKHYSELQVALCHEMSGRYWKVANLDGTPVYRQESPQVEGQLNCNQLFLWRNDLLPFKGHRGWYITRDFGIEAFEGERNKVAWGRPRASEPHTFPDGFHVPYNAAKAELGIEVCSYTTYLEAKLEECIQLEQEREVP